MRPQPLPGHTRATTAPAAKREKFGFFRLAVLTLIVLTISRVYGLIPLLQAAHPAALLVLLAVGYAVLNPKRVEIQNLGRSWHARMVGILFIVACLSVAFGISSGRAGKFILTDWSKTLLEFPLLVLTIRAAADLRRLVWAVLIAAAFLVWLSVFVFGISKTQGAFGYDANDVGCVIVSILPLAVLAVQASRGWTPRLAAVGLLVGMGITIAKSQSRGAFVGLLAAALMMLLTLRPVSISKRVITLVILALGLVLTAGQRYWTLMSSLEKPTSDYNWSAPQGRRELAKRGLGYLAGHPIFGIGIHNFPLAELTISPYAQAFVDRPGRHIKESVAHNTLIQVAAEMGGAGALVWLALWVGAFLACARVRSSLPRSWRQESMGDLRFLYLATYYVPAAVVGYLVTSTFVSFAYHDLTYVMLALVAAVPLAGNREISAEQARARTSGRHCDDRRSRMGHSLGTRRRDWPEAHL